MPDPLDTHGSPELDEDAAKLRELGVDPGPTLGDLLPDPLEDDGFTLVVTPQEFARMKQIIAAEHLLRGADAAAAEALRACGVTEAQIAERRGKVTRIEVRRSGE
jgi:hypothetical protein